MLRRNKAAFICNLIDGLFRFAQKVAYAVQPRASQSVGNALPSNLGEPLFKSAARDVERRRDIRDVDALREIEAHELHAQGYQASPAFKILRGRAFDERFDAVGARHGLFRHALVEHFVEKLRREEANLDRKIAERELKARVAAKRQYLRETAGAR